MSDNINGKTFSHRPITELMAIVKNDFRKMDDEGLIDEGTIIKAVMWCNDRLGIPIREVKQKTLVVEEFECALPLDFDKMYYICALSCTNTATTEFRNPFDNTFDTDIIYEADIDRESFGGTDHYGVTIKRFSKVETKTFANWVGLTIAPNSMAHCHIDCPNTRKPGKYQVEIIDGKIRTPFRKGELYIMYLGNMKDEDGNILFPFHPMITPWYEWVVKEKVIMDAIFNSDGNYSQFLQVAQREKVKAWLDAYAMTITKGYGEYVEAQRRKELVWYNQYFKYFQ